MPDYGLDLEFGIFPTPDASRHHEVLELAQLADVLGLDHVSIQDHPYQAAHLDTWTLLSAIGSRTSQVRLSTNVANLPLRPPVVLAKAAATLDLLTGGRVELGLGAGAFWDGIVAAGGERRTPGESVDALAEAVTVMRAFWAGEPGRFEGEHYATKGLRPGPRPAHDIPIWLGAYRPRMIRLTGRVADGWVPSMAYADPSTLPDLSARLDEAAVTAGRAPRDIRRIYNISGRFGSGSGLFQGGPGDWAEQLTDLAVGLGMCTFILGADEPDVVRRFAEEVVPLARELVAAERGGGQPDEATPTRVAGVPPAVHTVAAQDPSTFTPEQLAVPRHLVEVHDHLRRELEQVRDIVRQVREGHESVGAARSVINTMTMRQNNWTLGAYCESYCRIVTGHHTNEDRGIFPHLVRADPALEPVVTRLHDEHEVIAGLLDGLDRALVALVGDAGHGSTGKRALDGLSDALDALSDSLLAHLSYEEEALHDPLAVHGFG
ncbi:LLM class flavin-dependent oxidoreductase [Knoellia aerolata]|uniref:N5,N10-methylene tetrahydromethanopterin reductase n=1 Tax=Knoellia aerolata DSM 18566 TaxID=1385519 RepID=A0A0A0K1T0_9MICO|nr:LLM class flavin-dependent oxidoreductase [Knoellia aerolata]KGN42287.1 N5,N10-methylene tetrahydromethanopterin reductase [Knoellia aerolata DSM 18566]